MSDDFHRLQDFEEIKPEALQLPRAIALLSAVGRNRTFSVLGACKLEKNSTLLVECLIVEVKLHGIPSGNPVGILFRERLGLCVPANDKKLVEALALRKAFPRLMHQNGVAPGAPISLCLHFEPPMAVLRTWTPERFLARLHWWMNESAAGTLHVADQPLDAIFFSTRYELVLPWDFNARSDLSSYVIQIGPERPDGGATFTLLRTDGGKPKELTISPIELHLTAVHHGTVESQPDTLGQLVDVLRDRGVDLLAALTEKLREELNAATTKSIPLAIDERWSVLLLYVPMTRRAGDAPEAELRKAFLIKRGRLAIGLQIKALVQYNKDVIFDHMGKVDDNPDATWRAEELFGVELLRANTKVASRLQSGIDDEGPIGIALGAGSLGGAILEMWVRSGWGTWSVIDKDHVRPHNLSRHGADQHLLGIPKAFVASIQAQEATGGANTLKYVVDDVLRDTAAIVSQSARGTDLVVDMTTTLDYPRLASTLKDLPRHLSAFLTPDGNSAVLMAEDKARTTTLLSLEAQYYRQLIRSGWGATHLAGNFGKFWSGAGCRDVSVVLPYARILTHAGNLAEQIRTVARADEAAVHIWTRDGNTGEVISRKIQGSKQIAIRRGEMSVILDEELIESLRQRRSVAAPNETGGIILGYVDFNVNAIVVVDALAAPVDSIAGSDSFIRGKAEVLEGVLEAKRRTADVVGYIGEWHCHPPGHTAHPSMTDVDQLAMTSLGMAQEGLPAITLIIGGEDFSVLLGVVR